MMLEKDLNTQDAGELFLLPSDLAVYIIGKRCLQNELLYRLFLQRVGEQGFCIYAQAPPPPESVDRRLQNLLLWDLEGGRVSDSRRMIEAYLGELPANCEVMLFNVNKSFDGRDNMLRTGVSGVFSSSDSLADLARGIDAILSRRLLEPPAERSGGYGGQESDAAADPPASGNCLTKREREILLLITGGMSNAAIASRLNISICTVKTHVYNIYKKIGVLNRVQASLWATKHL